MSVPNTPLTPEESAERQERFEQEAEAFAVARRIERMFGDGDDDEG